MEAIIRNSNNSIQNNMEARTRSINNSNITSNNQNSRNNKTTMQINSTINLNNMINIEIINRTMKLSLMEQIEETSRIINLSLMEAMKKISSIIETNHQKFKVAKINSHSLGLNGMLVQIKDSSNSLSSISWCLNTLIKPTNRNKKPKNKRTNNSKKSRQSATTIKILQIMMASNSSKTKIIQRAHDK